MNDATGDTVAPDAFLLDATCTPGLYQCVGDNVVTCTQDGSGWLVVQHCADGGYVCSDGVCTTPKKDGGCTAGDASPAGCRGRTGRSPVSGLDRPRMRHLARQVQRRRVYLRPENGMRSLANQAQHLGANVLQLHAEVRAARLNRVC